MIPAPQLTNPPSSAPQQEFLGPPPITTHLQQAVLQGISANRGDGSALAYDTARQEFKEFCESLYPNSEFKYLVDPHKVFYFIFYTAMREQKSRGGRRPRKGPGVAPLAQFNRADYDAVMATYTVWWDANPTEAQELPNPTNPVGIESMTQ